MTIFTSFDPALFYITLKWNIVTVNLREFRKPDKIMVRIYDILLTEISLYIFVICRLRDIMIHWNGSWLNSFHFQMTSSRAILLFVSYLSICQDTYSTPIVPLSLNFENVVRPFSIKVDSSDASIGPGLGGSPILVDTSQHKAYK